MIMTSALRGLRVCLALVLFLAASALFAGHRSGVSINERGDAMRCEDLSITIDGERPSRAQETLRIPDSPGRALRVRVPNHSGIRVVGTDRRDVEVLVCKAAMSADDLARVTASQEAGELTVHGPSGDDWVAYLLIAAPRDAALDLEAENAPIGLRDLSGRVTARTVNGPISLKDCAGEIEAEADNGPIHFAGAGGHLRLRTENGPIAVVLSGAAWSGAGLDASAVNGPVDLSIPAGYRSGAVVESLGHAPVQCRGEACAAARRTWDEGSKRIELGDGPAVVHLSTRNGPVSVRSGGGEDVDDGEDEE